MDSRRAPVDRVLGAEINGEAIAFTFEALSEEIVVNYTLGGEDVVAFWQAGSVSALDQSVIDQSRDVGMAGLFSRNLDGQTLTFSHQDGTIVDDQTGSTWNVFGTATSGDFAGNQLQQINAFPHFWFAWAAFYPETEIYGEVKTTEAPNSRAEHDPILGNPDAPVTIIEYGAYACPSCKAWHEAEIIEQILEEYPDQVKFIFRDFPVISPNYDRMAAELAQCVLDQSQDQFWAFHDALYTIARPTSSEADLIEIARMVGVDTAALQSCADSDIHVATVEYDFQRGIQMGLPGTPSFLVNGQSIFNASPQMLRSIIESELASVDS
jgi:protein-disulfide isomerase